MGKDAERAGPRPWSPGDFTTGALVEAYLNRRSGEAKGLREEFAAAQKARLAIIMDGAGSGRDGDGHGIDRNDLDRELERHPAVTQGVVDVLADARYFSDFLSGLAKAFRPAFIERARADRTAAGEKVTETGLASAADADPLGLEIVDMSLLWRRAVAALDGEFTVVLQKGSAMNRLVTLWEGGYFAADSAGAGRRRGRVRAEAEEARAAYDARARADSGRDS